MEYICINQTNIESEHICCGFSDKKCAEGYQEKKNWLKKRLKEGYTFLKADVRGKVFIEYGDAEKAWAPILAPDYTFISCFWVSGQFKNKGYAVELLQQCKHDSNGKNGICVITANKKKPFLSDATFFKKQGFELCDTSFPYFELWYLPLRKNTQKPRFNASCKNQSVRDSHGIEVFYTHQCPFTSYYTHNVLANTAKKYGLDFKAHLIDSHITAQNHNTAFALYSIFLNGQFLTHEILSEKKMVSLLSAQPGFPFQ